MSIPVQCKSCGHAFKAKEKYAGRRGGCPKCGATVNVPAIKLPAASSASGESGLSIQDASSSSSAKVKGPSVTLACGDCGRRFKAQLRSTPREAVCPGCGVELSIPAREKPKSKPAAAKRPTANEDSKPSSDLWADLPAPSATGGDATIWFGDRNTAASSSPAAPVPQLPKKSNKRKSSGGISFDNPVKLGIGGLLAVLVLGFGAVSGHFLLTLLILVSSVVLLAPTVCYVIVIVKMFQNGRIGLALFSMFGWVIGVVFMLLFPAIGAGMDASSGSPGAAMGVGILGLVLGVGIFCISAATPYFVGWAKANEWNLGGVMLTWTGSAILMAVLSFVPAAVLDTDELANQNMVADGTGSLYVPRSQSPRANGGAGETNKEPPKTGPHVKLANAVYVFGKNSVSRFPEIGVSVDYTFDPKRTESRLHYIWVIENSLERNEMRLMDRGQGTLRGTITGFPSVGPEKKEKPTNWQCWIEIEPFGVSSGTSRSRVSDVVSMRSASKLPPPKEYVPLAGSNDPPAEDNQASSSSTPSRIPTPSPSRPMPTPPKEIDLDAALAMLAEGDKQRIKTGLKWFRDHRVDESRQSEVAKAIATHLEHPDGFTRKDAAEALRIWGTDEQIPQWIDALKGDRSVANQARDALAETQDPRAANALVDLMQSDRFGASKALIKMGRPAEDAVITLLEHPDTFMRSEASKILGEIGGKNAMRALKKLARDPSAISRNAAEKAFYQIEFREKQAEDRKPSSALERVD